MKTIVLASHNPVKARACENGFRRMFPAEELVVQQMHVPSGVADQPVTDAETLQGAENRAAGAAQRHPQADYWVGIEGGIEDEGAGGAMTGFAWIVVRSPAGLGKSRTGTVQLPPEVARLVRQGKELGEADDIVFGRSNSKQAEGACGLLTHGAVDRTALYEQSVVLALVSFRNPELYKPA
ncbi:MAG: inosine/xanthosine triphosphatase [Acidobacteriota bacterium]